MRPTWWVVAMVAIAAVVVPAASWSARGAGTDDRPSATKTTSTTAAPPATAGPEPAIRSGGQPVVPVVPRRTCGGRSYVLAPGMAVFSDGTGCYLTCTVQARHPGAAPADPGRTCAVDRTGRLVPIQRRR